VTTTDYAQLKAARELLTRIPLPLDVEAGETPGTPYTVAHDGTAEHGTATARTLLAAMARQLDDYILPRSASVDTPLTIVVGGSTGAGKSTIVKLIERFYEPTEGIIRANTTNIKDLPMNEWRSAVGFVPQEAHLFTGTIAENIAYGRPTSSQEEITDAARRVGALHAIAAIPGGFNARIGERGRGLSSGQRQLVALARAEMIHPQLLLLDEATATLDPATEKTIVAASNRVTQARTAVVVAHRLATARRADLILVVSDGVIVESGTHELLLSFGGSYATMWQGKTP